MSILTYAYCIFILQALCEDSSGGGSRQPHSSSVSTGSSVRGTMSKAEYFFKSHESLATVIDNEEDVGEENE